MALALQTQASVLSSSHSVDSPVGPERRPMRCRPSCVEGQGSVSADSSRRLALALLLTSLALASPAAGTTVKIDFGGNVSTVNDGGANDFDPAANAIEIFFFHQAANGKWQAAGIPPAVSGKLRAVYVPNVSATITLTDVQIENSASPGVVADTIKFIHEFPALGPIAVSNASLDGSYGDSAGGQINSADIVFDPMVNVTIAIGKIDPPAHPNGPIAFDGASGPKPTGPVTQQQGDLTFALDNNDYIRLPGSATIVTVVPEPATSMLLGLGVFMLAARRSSLL